jgi:hypothetical protein
MEIVRVTLLLVTPVLICLASANSLFAAKAWTIVNNSSEQVNVKVKLCDKKEAPEILFQTQLRPKASWSIDFPDDANHYQLFCASLDTGVWKDKNVGDFLVFGLWDATREPPEWTKGISIVSGIFEIIDRPKTRMVLLPKMPK